MDLKEERCLRSEVNGLELGRGELYLTLDELRWIQLEIGSEYGFVVFPSGLKPNKSRKNKNKGTGELENGGYSGSNVHGTYKRQRTSSGSALRTHGRDEGSANSSTMGDSYYQGKLTRNSLNIRGGSINNCTSSACGVSDKFDENKKASAESGAKKDLSNIKFVDFKNYSLNLLDKLSKNANARWFLQPVDPELDGVPDYFSVIENPMDFQTIREKLLQNTYKNPFGWQLDMRLVFYNALKYHKEVNTVRQDALSLAIEFENKCKDIKEVNPYYYSLFTESDVNFFSDRNSNTVSEFKNKLLLLEDDILDRIYKLITDEFNKKGGVACSSDTKLRTKVSPELIIEKLKDKSGVFQEQIILLTDMILDLSEKRKRTSLDSKEKRIQNSSVKSEQAGVKCDELTKESVSQDHQCIAMTPSSDESSNFNEHNLPNNASSEDRDNYYRIDYSHNYKDTSSRDDNTNNNSDFNSSEEQDGVLYSQKNNKQVLNSSFSNNSFSIQPEKSAWGEWKAKVIQDSTVAQRENAPKKSKREREAEQADAEI